MCGVTWMLNDRDSSRKVCREKEKNEEFLNHEMYNASHTLAGKIFSPANSATVTIS